MVVGLFGAAELHRVNPISWEVRYWHSHDPPFSDWPRLSPPYLYAPIWVIRSTRRVSNRGTFRDLYPRAAPRLVAPMRAEHWIRSSPALRTFSRVEIWFAIFFSQLWFSGVQSKVRYRHFHRPLFCDWPRGFPRAPNLPAQCSQTKRRARIASS